MKKSVFFFRQKFPKAACRRQRQETRAQVLVEYCLILVAIVLVCIGLVYALDQQTGQLYSQIGSNLSRMGSP